MPSAACGGRLTFKIVGGTAAPLSSRPADARCTVRERSPIAIPFNPAITASVRLGSANSQNAKP
jgi:hypothetical protein